MTDPVRPPAEAGGDPSMEDILASIRRILNEDDTATLGGAPTDSGASPNNPGATLPGGLPHTPPVPEADVLVLQPSMIVQPGAEISLMASEPPFLDRPVSLGRETVADPASTEQTWREPPVSSPVTVGTPITATPSRPSDLLAPESEAAAVSAVGSLLRSITAERSSQVHRGGPTIEDLVREELRPLLKSWLDLHLPPMVERLVRSEIERVAGRAGT